MPLETSELLDPIPGDNPGGEYLRYNPIYDQIRQARTEEEDLPSGEWERERKTADFGLVIKLSREVLANRSKDLQIAAWLTEALLKREGFGGLATGLDVIRGLLDDFWDHLHPELEEDDDAELRAAPLVWVGEYLDRAIRMTPIVQEGYDMASYRESRSVGYEEEANSYEKREIRSAAIEAGRMTAEDFDAAFNATPKAWYKLLVADIDRAIAAAEALARVSDDKFGRDAPRYSPLVEAVGEVRQVAAQLLAQKLARDPDPMEAVMHEEPAAAPGATGAPSPGAGAVPGVSVPGLFSAPAAAPVPQGGRAGAEASIAAAARFLRRESAADPGPYLMLRGLRWGELRAGGDVDPALLAAPPTEVRTRVKSLLMEEKWADLLEAAEEVMATAFGRGWLDLQRYVVAAADALGEEYAAVGRSVRGALRTLLQDLPELAAMTLADDTPTANAETRAWLRAEGMLAEQAESGGEEPPPPAPRRPRFDPLARARELATGGQPDQAVDLLMREAAQERSPRGRFLRRTQAAAILVDAGLPTVALPILEDLSETIAQHNLEAWEDAEAIAQPLGLLYRCHVAIDGDGSAVHDLFVRVCRLDPLQAIGFAPRQRAE
jgi:type VI secretion system protein ImpA